MLAQPFFMRKEVVSKRWHNLFLLDEKGTIKYFV